MKQDITNSGGVPAFKKGMSVNLPDQQDYDVVSAGMLSRDSSLSRHSYMSAANYKHHRD